MRAMSEKSIETDADAPQRASQHQKEEPAASPPDPKSADRYRHSIAETMFLHPRVAYQDMVESAQDRLKFAAAVPDLVPFGDHEYKRFCPILDWDHRLPSKELVLRVYAYYSKDSFALGKADRDARLARIRKLDKFPEFDVPDFSAMVSDEAYDIKLDLDGKALSSRLTSPWRRDINSADAAKAVSAVRRSTEFMEINRAFPDRPDNLGDSEAVSYTPPCESGFPRWTVDVWYLVAYDGMHGKGRSFLVDLVSDTVVAVREFTVRPD
jgi:hypothetical protein